jgi:putative salt-induced outer membrane protein
LAGFGALALHAEEIVMRKWIIAAAALTLAVAANTAQAATLPQAVIDVIDAAAEDPEQLKAVVKAVKKANPDATAEIDAHVAALTKRVAAEKAERAAKKGFFSEWTGEVTGGGSIMTGNTKDNALNASLKLDRKTPDWEHEVNLLVDLKSEKGETTKERYFGTYSILRNLNPRLYAGLILWGEGDRFAGYKYRFSESVGLGYRLINKPTLELTLEAGPAVRQSQYLVTGYENTAALRMAEYLTWKVTPRVEFTQSLVTYRDTENSTVLAATAITARVIGNLSARASYELRNEENPPEGRENTDTTTRATLAYEF